MIRVKCDKCGQGYKAADESAGAILKCKNCGELLRVPSPEVPPPALPVPEPISPNVTPQTKPAPVRKSRQRRWGELSYSYLFTGLIIGCKGAWVCYIGINLDTVVGDVYNTGLLHEQALLVSLGSSMALLSCLMIIAGSALMVAASLVAPGSNNPLKISVLGAVVCGCIAVFFGSYIVVPIGLLTIAINTMVCLSSIGTEPA